MQIDVSLDVFKALTHRLAYDGQSYDDVLRDLLGFDSPVEPEPVRSDGLGSLLVDQLDRQRHLAEGRFFSRGLALPDGTHLRARYKGQEYRAQIMGGRWLDAFGAEHQSPSAAASTITGNNVNGLRFWECWRPGDLGWRKLDAVVADSK